MTASVFQSILCPTDFSEVSIPAFAHALRIAIGARSELHLLNVARYAALDHAPLPFPRVRNTLIKWGHVKPGSAERGDWTGAGRACGAGSSRGLQRQPPSPPLRENACLRLDCDGDPREDRPFSLEVWFDRLGDGPGAVLFPTLYLRAGSSGFVDRETGAVSLKRALLPVDPSIPPFGARRLVEAIALALQCPLEIRLLSVGRGVDLGGDWPAVANRSGPIVDAIVDYAQEIDADLIVMPTAGRRGLFDALAGSTTSAS